ncbi:MAG: hypothetical protein ACD_15C00160G0003 [uncultured bacterium]|nr:MAG: hypothetical protein ACD_15C00160G0003 [uncultured bacterium]KKP68347.1 MAG: hypothetical protein UR66_C0006G0048 [Candidatus Moranbacteria bacterium GW2011_GWE1_35_17]KKP73166.1 MAG: hypothetical protein UR65_C0006G0010 [Candidatus Moranbacteria bacterium GW2011_GWE2_35_164]KKP84268.1 MAG: hypothetical protein UR82_C0009G0015 [Candidatus Moranbacteria bacterium GW2011_GWF1_35_5]KKP84919.1 MAG: hypothetical protein UR83_C0008G0033 [Candidatus Moranbacteria bacterium GW2011_GWF2_35_54]
MNIYLKKFTDKKFKNPAKALDLGAGDFKDVLYLRELGWECEGVDRIGGVDLEKTFKSENGPYDLVFSNYLLHKLKNKEALAETAFENLRKGGWLFIHTFEKSDKISFHGVDIEEIKRILKGPGFIDIEYKIFDVYDEEVGHKHWHKILEVSAKRP